MATPETQSRKTEQPVRRRPGNALRPAGEVPASAAAPADLDGAYLASIVESSDDAITSFSAEGVFLLWNPGAERLFGYGAEEMVGKNLAMLVPGDRRQEIRRILKVAKGDRMPRFETVRLRKDGSRVDVELSVSPVIVDGRVVAAMAVGRDITQRRRMEESLRSHAELLALAQESARLGVFEWDLVANKAHWTAEMQELLELELADAPDNVEPWFAGMHPEDRERMERAIGQWMESRQPDATLQYRLSSNGEERWFEMRARILRDSQGRALRMIGANLDITERKRAEAEIREGQDRFRAVLENSLDAAYRRNLQADGYDYMSPVIEQITGYTPEELGSKPLDAVLKWIHPADIHHVRRAVKRAVAGGQPCRTLEYRFRCKDGAYRWLAESFRILYDSRGRPLHLVGIVRDVSERKQMEEALRESQRLARSTVEAIPAQIAVIDAAGTIIDTNEAWRRFARANGGSEKATGRGTNYLKVCDKVHGLGRREAARFAAGIRSVLKGRKRLFSMEYPCHSPRERRWFTGYVTPFAGDGERRLVVAHVNITPVKLAEDAIRTLNAELEKRVAVRTAALSQANQSLQQAIQDRRQLEQEVIEISETERQRIGQDLHDDLGQQLAGLWFFSASLERSLRAAASPEAENAAKIAGMLDKALALTRSLARGLQPVMPEAGGLMAALRALAERSSEMFKVPCRFACRRRVQVHDPAIATHLYRIAQEAVTNAGKHGKAKHISITLSTSRRKLSLSVNDDGAGIDPPEGRGGMGFRTMTYRAEAIGGSLVIRKRARGGTSVLCTIPTTGRIAQKKD